MIKKNSRHNTLAFYVMQIPQNQTLTTKTNEYEHLPGFFLISLVGYQTGDSVKWLAHLSA